jgi:hypothetical protein
MVTNYPQLTATQPVTADLAEPRLLGRFLAFCRQVSCALRGHDSMLHFEENRVRLRCVSCGHESTGWDVGEQRPRLRFAGDARRHRMRRAPILVIRKTA